MQRFTEMSDRQFVDFLFNKLSEHVDTEMLDLDDDDSIQTALDFHKLEEDQ